MPERPPIATAPISVVLIASGREADVPEAVRAWVSYLDGLGQDYEILLVDDGNRGQTEPAVDATIADQSRVRELYPSDKRGSGAAIRTALAAARHPLVFYTTADRRYQPADLKRLLDEIDRVDLVSGCRIAKAVPAWLRWAGRAYRWFIRIFGISLDPLPGWLGWKAHAYSFFIRLLFGVRLIDGNSAFKLFRRAIFSRIPIQSDGPFVHAEILAKANFLGCLMSEVPFPYGGDPSDPPVALRQLLAEARQVFWHPDFGPPVLPENV